MVKSDRAPARTYSCDLGTRLWQSPRTFRAALGEQTVLYAPHCPGMPVVVDSRVASFYDGFKDGATVGRVIADNQGPDGRRLPEWLCIAGDLVERGLLQDARDTIEHAGMEPRRPRKSMNVWLHLNNDCNLACSYCFVRHTRERMTPATIATVVDRLVATVRRYEVEDVLIKFAGGEPTLAIAEMESFHERLTAELPDAPTHVHWAVLTNGTRVTDRLMRFIEKAKLSVSISVDGYGAYHDLYRVFRDTAGRPAGTAPRGSWEQVERNIRWLKDRGVVPYINAMAGPKTSRGLRDLARWIFGNGMLATVHVVRNLGDSWAGGSPRMEEYARYCEQLAEDFEAMFQELERPEYVLRLPRWLEIAELSFDHPSPGVCCGIGCDHIVIRHDGCLASCPMTVNEQAVPSTEDLFEGAMRTYADRFDVGAERECVNCQWFPVCAGACPVTNERLCGDPWARSPLCAFWRYVIPRYVLFYGRKLLGVQASQQYDWSGFPAR